MRRIRTINNSHVTTLVVALMLAAPASAATYPIPPDGNDVIGEVSTVTATHDDTLIEIARRHGLGYEDIVRANPHVNVWVPGEGTEVVLPTRYVLPAGPRSGVVLNLAEYRMYYYPEPQAGEAPQVLTYPVSIGRMDWETPIGTTEVVAKSVNPTWYPPQSVLDEHAADGDPLPRVVPPGPKNPLGTRAMRLGLPGYLIHGTNRPAGVGMRVTHGCIRMFPEDIEFLYPQVAVKTKVRIVNQPVKFGWHGDELVIEVHPELGTKIPQLGDQLVDDTVVEVRGRLTNVTEMFVAVTSERAGALDWHLAEEVVNRSDGIPATVGQGIKNAATSAASE